MTDVSSSILTSQDWKDLRERGWLSPRPDRDTVSMRAVDGDGNPPLFYALGGLNLFSDDGTARLDIAHKLIESGADPHWVNDDGENAWFYCLDLIDGAAFLMEHGVDINRPDVYGMTAGAHWLMKWSHPNLDVKKGLWLTHDTEEYRQKVITSMFRYGLKTEYDYVSLAGEDEHFNVLEQVQSISHRLHQNRIVSHLSNEELFETIRITLEKERLEKVLEQPALPNQKSLRL